MPVIATLGAASVRGFGGFYETTAISASNWIAKAGGRLFSSAFDGTGNLYSNTSAGTIIKTASDGSAIWKKRTFIGSSSFFSEKIAIASPNVIHVVGSYFTSDSIPVFAVLNSDGNVTSARSITTGGSLSYLAVSSSGAVYTSGYMQPTSGASTVTNSFFRIFNNSITAKRYYNNNAEVNFSFIGAGSSDSAYIGGDVLTAVPIMKINSSFSTLWKFRSSSIDAIQAVESNGNLYIAAQYNTGPLLAVMKLNASTGAFVWARTLSGTFTALCVAVDDSSNVYVGGRDSTDSVIIKVDGDGNLVWQRSVSIGVTSRIRSISVNTATNTIYALCTPSLTANSYSFILSLPTDGSLTGTYSVGGTSVTYSSTSGTFSTLTPTFTSPSLSFTTSTLADTSRTLTVDEATTSYDLITLP
jgi:hypothetical protein